MDAVWQKIRADLTSRPVISGLILVTLAASATLLTLALATLMNLSAPYDQAFAELNAAHVWLYFDRARLSPRDVDRIEALPEVAASTGLRYSLRTQVRLRDTRVWVSVRMLPAEMPAVNALLLKEGRYFAPDETEVVAAKDLDDLYTLSVGEPITLTTGAGGERTLPVVGLAYNPMWDTYRNSQPPYLYVGEETMRRLFPDESTWDWSLGLRLEDPEAVEATIDRVETLLHDDDAVVAYTDWREVKRSAVFGAKINFIFLGAFGFFALVATVLVIATSIGSTVLTQFRQIGILKTLGFTRAQVLWLYIGQYLILGVIGSGIGLLLGNLLAPLPLRSVAASLSTTYEPPLNVSLVLAVVGGVLAVAVSATLTAASRGARTNIIRAITTGAESPRTKFNFDVKWVSRWSLPVALRLGMNDVFARPLRSFLTGLNLMLGVIGIVFGLTINATLDAYRADPSLLGIVYDARVTRESYSDRKTRYLLRKAPGVAAFYSEALVEAETLSGDTFQVRAVEGNLEAFPFRISEGRFFRPHTHEAIAGRGLLNWLELEVGDTLTVFLEEDTHHPVTLDIVGQYPEPVNTGEMLMVSYPTIERQLSGIEPRSYLLQLTSKSDPARLKRYLEPDADADLNFVLAKQAIPDVVVYLQLAIFALSVILIGIALINVFNTSLLSMQEKIATVGILKTVGMTPRQVMTMFNAAAGFLGLLATVLGVPIGWGLTRILMQTLANTYGFGEVNVILNPMYVIGLFPVMIGISILGSLLPGRRAAQLAIVRVLRHE